MQLVKTLHMYIGVSVIVSVKLHLTDKRRRPIVHGQTPGMEFGAFWP